MNPEAVDRSPSICCTAEKNPGKPQLGDCLMGTVWPVNVSNGAHYFQMTSVESFSTSEGETGGDKEGMGRFKDILKTFPCCHLMMKRRTICSFKFVL